MNGRLPVPVEVSIRFVSRVVLMAIATAVTALAVVLVAPKAVGGQSLSVLSGSMAPNVNTGDMVAIVPIDATDVEVGHIVAFNDPNGSGKLYQHRVQAITEDNGQMIVVTKGDANTSGEEWQTPVDSEVGRVVLVVPVVGKAVGTITGGKPVQILGRDIPIGTLAITIVLFVLAGFVIAGILRSNKKDDPDVEDTPEVFDQGEQHNFVHQQEEEPTHA